MPSLVTRKNVSWPRLIWTTLYIHTNYWSWTESPTPRSTTVIMGNDGGVAGLLWSLRTGCKGSDESTVERISEGEGQTQLSTVSASSPSAQCHGLCL